MPTQPKLFAVMVISASDIGVSGGASGTASPVCMIAPTRSSRRPSLPPGCSSVEVVGGEALALQHGDGDGVAERQHHRRRGGRRQAHRAGFRRIRQHQRDVGGLGERAACAAR